MGRRRSNSTALTPSAVQESDELYFLATCEGARGVVQVSNDLMDIKMLKEINADGLEQWMRVMKAPIPPSAVDVSKAFEAVRVEMPSLLRNSYSLDQFIDELPEPRVIGTVQVHGAARAISSVAAAPS